MDTLQHFTGPAARSFFGGAGRNEKLLSDTLVLHTAGSCSWEMLKVSVRTPAGVGLSTAKASRASYSGGLVDLSCHWWLCWW